MPRSRSGAFCIKWGLPLTLVGVALFSAKEGYSASLRASCLENKVQSTSLRPVLVVLENCRNIASNFQLV